MQYQLWIDGAWVESKGGGVLSVENPASGEKIAEVVDASTADVDCAVQAARTAFYDGRWSRLTPGERSKILWKLADLLEAHAEEFARVETENTGKPYQYVSLNADTVFSIDNLRFFAAAARDTHGSHAGEYMAGYTSVFRREPVGVVGQIAPWNYPLMMAVWKLGPALAAGCTTVLKPASLTPLSTLKLAELFAEAGIPAGVVNIVTGRKAGQALVEHPDVRMISVTGSTEVGQSIMRNAAGTVKRLHLELGGKAPLLVFADADLEMAAQKAAMAATFNTGQDCTAATRVYVEASVAGDFQEALVEAVRATRVGDPFDEATQVGPMISGGQRESVRGFVERAQAGGARLLTGGGVPQGFERGYYYEPTVIAGADQKAEIIQCEVFGPVVTVNAFRDEAEAVALGNDVVYGLASSVFTTDVGRAMRVSSQLEFGTVWVNDHIPLASETPHGGFKQSGFGKDLSAEAVGDYLITKHVMISQA
ncbi:MAG: gamma-aminobutyraldehyde dehydrogenase [Chloroflexi bacterium]|nr:gamma-aminobutyraldehyde dehydrogenase [Anaerolineaceae bacterium]NMB88456.1 gamma-aminobutyraldehyde dehydrogenase [Chloroflexota bacterium]